MGEREDSNSCDDLGYKHAIFRLFQGILPELSDFQEKNLEGYAPEICQFLKNLNF